MSRPVVLEVPIVDPGLPEEVRERLAAHHAGELPRPGEAAPGLRGIRPADVLFAVWQTPVWAVLPGLMGTLYSRSVRTAAWIAQAAVVAGLVVFPVPALVVLLTLQPAVLAALLAQSGEGAAGRLARRYRAHYFRPGDLRHSRYALLLRRATGAVAAVLSSRVNEQGLLDDIRNTVVLPQQVWEIAGTLFQLDGLAAEHAGADASDPEVAKLLAPQQQVLKLAADSVTERIKALEKYAEQVRLADEALQQWETVQRLAAQGDAYQELLARTVRDSMAVSEINELTDQARTVQEALRSSVEEARRAGLALVIDGKAS